MTSSTLLPAPVPRIDPTPIRDAPHLVHVASYLLPVLPRDAGAHGPHWFWLHAYHDGVTGRERVVLAYGSSAESALVRIQRVALLERLRVRSGGVHRRRWDAAVRAMVEHGTGYAVLEPLDDVTAADDDAVPDPASVTLLAQHIGPRRTRLLLVGDDERATAPAIDAALAARGVRTDGRLAVVDGG